MNAHHFAETRSAHASKLLDPIQLQVVKQRIVAVPNLIEKNVERTAFSVLVQEYKDYAVGFVDPTGRLVAQSRHSLPAFVANALGLAVRAGLREIGEDDMHSGDIMIVSEAAVLGKHINDVVAYTPVRAQGRLLGFFAVLVHWIDVGGAVTGSCFSPSTTDVFQEGTQFPTVKLVSRGKRVRDIFRIIETNTRFPKLLMGDLEAQLGGCLMGHDMVQEIVVQYGPDMLMAAVDEMFTDADRAMERALSALPPGTYKASSFMDDDGVRIGEPIRIDVSVTIGDGQMTVDLSGLSEQLAGPFNAGRDGGAVAVARMAAKILFAGDTPVNEGDFMRVHVDIPDGKFLSARPDAPVGGAGNTSATVVDTIISALAPAMAGQVPAGHHGIYGTHTISGRLPSGERYLSLDAMSGGWGAFATADGPGPYRSLTHGDVRDVPVELQEAYYPYRIEAKQLRADSGGAGRHRGGLGIEKVYRFLQDCTLLAKVERTGCPPWGLSGGMPGSCPAGHVDHQDGRQLEMKKGQWPMKAGDSARILSGGGGGYGHPHERDPRSVAEDVRQGYVTAEAATLDYGVVVAPNGGVDAVRTAVLRGAVSADTGALFGEGQDLYLVMTRPVDGQDRLFNHWYSATHVHDLLAIPGIAAAQRFRLHGAAGQSHDGPPYLAIYALAETQRAIDGIVARRGTSLMPSTSALDRSASVAVVYSPAGQPLRVREPEGGGAMLMLGLNTAERDTSLDEALQNQWQPALAALPGINAVRWYRASDFQTKPELPRYHRVLYAHVDDSAALRAALDSGALDALLASISNAGGVASVIRCDALTAAVTPVQQDQ
ncbi:hydantoinase B/oxoprolinase family protein [Ottowia thiooxydans]|uniref:hydantoinase B/oxoprolinase family protein n=1 Tax=Ottowia thiooxydans TaxID=219182 RepID=UPI000422411B|nr:hydantoinase B/oxoprolinase family protein [Ottowia thiooxydans]